MRFEGMGVPGANWVEIVSIREKDGSPLAEGNWRHKLFGRITLCWIAGGFQKRGAFFKGKVYMMDGKPLDIDMTTERWTSTTTAMPVEVEPGIFDFETNTCIYRFRLLSKEEETAITDAIEKAILKELELRSQYLAQMAHPPVGTGGERPVS